MRILAAKSTSPEVVQQVTSRADSGDIEIFDVSVSSPLQDAAGFYAGSFSVLGGVDGNASVGLAPAPQSSNRSVVVTQSLNINSGATLDLTNNDLILGGLLGQNGEAGYGTINSEVATGFGNGHWTGTGGILSSTAAAVRAAFRR